MASVFTLPDLSSKKIVSESCDRILEPHWGTHFLMDEACPTSLTGAFAPGGSYHNQSHFIKTGDVTPTGNTGERLLKSGIQNENEWASKNLLELSTNQALLYKHLKADVHKENMTHDSSKVLLQNEMISNERVKKPYEEQTSTNNGSNDLRIKEISCKVCSLTFLTKELLNSHLNEKGHNCRMCDKKFEFHSDLKSHFQRHVSYTCVVCKRVFFGRKTFWDHKKDSISCNSKLECEICNKVYISNISLRKHLHSFHRNEGNIHKCVVCDQTFQLPFQLNAHQRSIHVAYERIECKLCREVYLGPESLKGHVKYVHEDKRPLACSVCGKVYYSKTSHENHEKSHIVAVETLECEICGRSCKGKIGLSAHMKYNHQDLKSINCQICNKEFKTKRMFIRHEKSAHQPKVPAVCEICGKTLKSKDHLRVHLQVHSSVRQFKCGICDATFKQKLSLKNHSRIHSDICKYNCTTCGESFRWKQTFDKHKEKCQSTLDS